MIYPFPLVLVEVGVGIFVGVRDGMVVGITEGVLVTEGIVDDVVAEGISDGTALVVAAGIVGDGFGFVTLGACGGGVFSALNLGKINTCKSANRIIPIIT